MTFAEMHALVARHFPEGMIEEDEYGQMVIHTNLADDGKGGTVPFIAWEPELSE